MSSDSEFESSTRIADEGIYLSEDRPAKSKEVFKMIGRLIETCDLPPDFRICDVGCATGEFLLYVVSQHPGCRPSGFDVSSKLIDAAREALPDAEFTVGSVTDEGCLPARRFDVITYMGIQSCLDDPKPGLLNLLAAVKKGGSIIIAGAHNPDPVDVLVRYRRADEEGSPWESGMNIFSCLTVEKILRETGYTLEFKWCDLPMPFAIERGDDPMRSWTTQVGSEPHFRVNGACLLLHSMALQVIVKDVP